jgi:hypothetical protein
VNGHPSVEDEYSKSEYVLTAAVVSASEVPESKDEYYLGGTDYTLRTLRTLMGHPPTTFKVFSENSSGRFPMTAKASLSGFCLPGSMGNCGSTTAAILARWMHQRTHSGKR